jgi:hypothetical protein
VQYLAFHFEYLIALALIVFAVAQMRSDIDRSAKLFLLTVFGRPLMLPAQYIAFRLSDVRPMKLDLYIYKIDALFGQPSFFLGHLARNSFVHLLIVASYNSLGMVMIGTCGVYLWKRPEEVGKVFKIFLLNLFLAVPFYLLFPVSGPKYAFPDFPSLPSAVSPHMLAIHAAPNGIPSVHTSTALLIFWLLRYWRSGRIFGAVFLALTVLSTLGSGEHYVFDLFCAIPYAALVLWLHDKPIVPRNRRAGGDRDRLRKVLETV